MSQLAALQLDDQDPTGELDTRRLRSVHENLPKISEKLAREVDAVQKTSMMTLGRILADSGFTDFHFEKSEPELVLRYKYDIEDQSYSGQMGLTEVKKLIQQLAFSSDANKSDGDSLPQSA